jgi:hypothetical protein
MAGRPAIALWMVVCGAAAASSERNARSAAAQPLWSQAVHGLTGINFDAVADAWEGAARDSAAALVNAGRGFRALADNALAGWRAADPPRHTQAAGGAQPGDLPAWLRMSAEPTLSPQTPPPAVEDGAVAVAAPRHLQADTNASAAACSGVGVPIPIGQVTQNLCNGVNVTAGLAAAVAGVQQDGGSIASVAALTAALLASGATFNASSPGSGVSGVFGPDRPLPFNVSTLPTAALIAQVRILRGGGGGGRGVLFALACQSVGLRHVEPVTRIIASHPLSLHCIASPDTLSHPRPRTASPHAPSHHIASHRIPSHPSYPLSWHPLASHCIASPPPPPSPTSVWWHPHRTGAERQ